MKSKRHDVPLDGLQRAARFCLSLTRFVGQSAALFVSLSLLLPVAAQADPLPAAVLAQLRDKGIRPDQLAFVARPVRASGSAGLDWTHNAQQPAAVASLVKLLTTGAALSRYGAEYGFRTELLGQRAAGSEVVQGPVYFRGSGDPDFQVEDLWVLLRQLRQTGVKEIRGSLVLDDSAFAHKAQAFARDPEGSFVDEGVYRAYHARPSAVLIGHGALGLQIRPLSGAAASAESAGTAAGNPATSVQSAGSSIAVTAPLAPSGFVIDNQLQVRRGDCVAWKDGLQVDWPQPDRLRIRGAYPVACGEQRLPVRVLDGQAWLALWFADVWQQLGGQGPRAWEPGKAPAGVPVLQTWRGRDLGLIVRNINKFSNNVMAQNLMLAATPPGQTTQEAIERWLAGLGITSFSGLQMGNGSGLSRTDRVPPALLADLLEAYYAEPAFPDFLASLPRAGADGTLSRRFGDLALTAHLKTGRLKGVSGLAGYLRDRKGRYWVWVSVLNGDGLEDRSEAHDILLKWFAAMLAG